MQTPPIRQLRMLVTPLILIVVTLFVVAAIIHQGAESPWQVPSVDWLAMIVLVSAMCALMCWLVGYRTPALGTGIEPEERDRWAVNAFRSAMIVRFALAEVPTVIGLALSFIVWEGAMVPVTIGVAVSLTLLCLHVWPNDRQIEKIQTSLEKGGARVPLRDILHGDTGGGPTRL